MQRRQLLGAGITIPALAFGSSSSSPEWENRRVRDLLSDTDKLFAILRDPFGLGRYADDNRRILAKGDKVDIVFMGDSITEAWKDKRPGFFKPGRVGRGISGQTTPQMLVRMVPDVIDLNPRAVHIMAGTNDIAGNTGPMTQEMTRDNIRGMTDIARRHGLRILLASIPPAASFPWREGLKTREPIAQLNAWLKHHADQIGATYVDYHAVLATPSGGMREGFAYDGVHPTEAGYEAMSGLLEPILKRLLTEA